ncbi:MAG: nicotinate-nucleotide adenylyltransferase [Acidobacteria bacterium]|nr:nicotinate-nucleotide adenylyltransferase [Acidobacteriota bacterium]
MRLGLFGGSFDPIHRGHLEPVDAAREALSLDRVVYLPTARPPHKRDRRFAPPYARFTMVELALLDRPSSFASAFELTPGRRAYTVDTVRHFRERCPDSELFLLLGADSLAGFHTWRRWQEIAQMAELIVLARPGWSMDQIPEDVPRELRELIAGKRVHAVENPPLDFSSSGLRRLLAEDPAAAAPMLPGLVLRYINKYALYRG